MKKSLIVGRREVPFLFKSEMVNAILNGTKTETRRLQGLEAVNGAPDGWYIFGQRYDMAIRKWIAVLQHKTIPGKAIICRAKPAPGQVIWVKETFYKTDYNRIVYRASAPNGPPLNGFMNIDKWKPSIFMRREYSRIDLLCSAVTCERLQDITEAGAIAEGIETRTAGAVTLYRDYSGPGLVFGSDPIKSYESLWCKINGQGSWRLNPWVFRYQFTRIKPAKGVE